MIRRGHLTLISGEGQCVAVPTTAPAPHQLVQRVVDAAQAWANYASAARDVAPTEENAARLALLDAVFDLEWHHAAPHTAISRKT